MPSSYPTRCPGCGSHYIRPSRSGVVRHLARLVFLHPIRCTSCRLRFWRFGLRPPHDPPRRPAAPPSQNGGAVGLPGAL
jgi:hypothetical protein